MDEPIAAEAPHYASLPEEFVASVRDAIGHLHDYAHLQRHPLAEALGLSTAHDVAEALRRELYQALEQLDPGPGVSRNAKEWRPYGILLRRYVDGFPVKEIRTQLHISLRQLQREHRRGLEALAGVLWQRAVTAPKAASSADGDLRDEVDNLGLALASTDVNALVSSVLAPVRAVAMRGGVALRVTPPRRPVFAWLDPTLARQALIGVLSSLIAGGPDEVELSWSDVRAQVVLRASVRPPLPAGELAEASERSQRLAAADDLLRAQGGALRQESGESGLLGVEVTLRHAGGASVLLIDDNERVLRLFERYLLAGGFSVSGTTNADAALDSISHQQPDAIVMDIMMRDMDGWQLLQRLRAIPELAMVPVVVCSVLREPEVALALGAQVYLKKPVSQQEMLAALRRVLGESSSVARRPAEP